MKWSTQARDPISRNMCVLYTFIYKKYDNRARFASVYLLSTRILRVINIHYADIFLRFYSIHNEITCMY